MDGRLSNPHLSRNISNCCFRRTVRTVLAYREVSVEGVPFHGSQDSPRPPRRFIEEVGRYNPCCHPHLIQFDMEKMEKWLANGAQPTDTVERLYKAARENA